MGIYIIFASKDINDEEAISPHNCDFAPVYIWQGWDICGHDSNNHIRSAVLP